MENNKIKEAIKKVEEELKEHDIEIMGVSEENGSINERPNKEALLS